MVEQELYLVYPTPVAGIRVESVEHHANFEIEGNAPASVKLSPGEVRSLIIGLLVVLNDLNTNEGGE